MAGAASSKALVCRARLDFIWPDARVVRERSAKPRTGVQIPFRPQRAVGRAKPIYTGAIPVLASKIAVRVNFARVVESLDTKDLKSFGGNSVRVGLPPRAHLDY